MKLSIGLVITCISLQAQVVPTQPVSDLEIVAKVNGKDITAGEVRASMASMPPEFAKMFEQNPKYAVQQIFVMRHLAEEAEKKKLDQQSGVKEQLAMTRANILANAMVTDEHNNYIVPQDLIDQYYEREKSRFRKAEIKVIGLAFYQGTSGALSGSLEDIARGVADGATGKAKRNEAETRKLAEDLLKQLRAGTDFAKLAAEYSDDPTSKAKGGEAQPITADSSHPEDWRTTIMALKRGEFAGPLRQGNSYFIVRLEQIGIQPLGEVREPVIQAIKQQHVNTWFQDVNKQFEPQVQNLQFFTRSAGTPVPGKPAGMPPAAPPPAR